MKYNSGKEIQVGDKVRIVGGFLECGEEAVIEKLAPTHSTHNPSDAYYDHKLGVEVSTEKVTYLWKHIEWLQEV